MKNLLLSCLLLLSPIAAAAAEWQADPDDERQVEVQDTIAKFLELHPDLADYFDQAWGYAVFPRVMKIVAVFVAAYGKGLVIEQDVLVGRCKQYLGSLGAQLGGQSYSQVILFRNAEVMEVFKRGRVEFNGRASVVAFKAGTAIDPANLPDIAIFSITRGGLMVEAAAAGVKYSYKPINTDK